MTSNILLEKRSSVTRLPKFCEIVAPSRFDAASALSVNPFSLINSSILTCSSSNSTKEEESEERKSEERKSITVANSSTFCVATIPDEFTLAFNAKQFLILYDEYIALCSGLNIEINEWSETISNDLKSIIGNNAKCLADMSTIPSLSLTIQDFEGISFFMKSVSRYQQVLSELTSFVKVVNCLLLDLNGLSARFLTSTSAWLSLSSTGLFDFNYNNGVLSSEEELVGHSKRSEVWRGTRVLLLQLEDDEKFDEEVENYLTKLTSSLLKGFTAMHTLHQIINHCSDLSRNYFLSLLVEETLGVSLKFENDFLAKLDLDIAIVNRQRVSTISCDDDCATKFAVSLENFLSVQEVLPESAQHEVELFKRRESARIFGVQKELAYIEKLGKDLLLTKKTHLEIFDFFGIVQKAVKAIDNEALSWKCKALAALKAGRISSLPLLSSVLVECTNFITADINCKEERMQILRLALKTQQEFLKTYFSIMDPNAEIYHKMEHTLLNSLEILQKTLLNRKQLFNSLSLMKTELAQMNKEWVKTAIATDNDVDDNEDKSILCNSRNLVTVSNSVESMTTSEDRSSFFKNSDSSLQLKDSTIGSMKPIRFEDDDDASQYSKCFNTCLQVQHPPVAFPLLVKSNHIYV